MVVVVPWRAIKRDEDCWYDVIVLMNPLTRDEIRFFKREGYLIKRGVLDAELMARARERKWEGAPARMQRDDPSTWFGPFRPDEEHGEECENCRIGFTWKYREPAREPWIVAMLATNPVVFEWAEQLLGRHEVETLLSTKGLARNEAYKRRIIEFNADPHVEGYGAAGDILIWHCLLAHTAGWNRSPRIQLREAVLCDYQKRENTLPERDQSFEDMWQGWSHEVRSLRHH